MGQAWLKELGMLIMCIIMCMTYKYIRVGSKVKNSVKLRSVVIKGQNNKETLWY